MNSTKNYLEYVTSEVLRDVPGITTRSMFGGFGIYKDNIFFALIADDQLYFKVDDSNMVDYQEAGSTPFVYVMKGKPNSMSYYLVPEEVMSNPETARDWALKSFEIAKEGKVKKK